MMLQFRTYKDFAGRIWLVKEYPSAWGWGWDKVKQLGWV